MNYLQLPAEILIRDIEILNSKQRQQFDVWHFADEQWINGISKGPLGGGVLKTKGEMLLAPHAKRMTAKGWQSLIVSQLEGQLCVETSLADPVPFLPDFSWKLGSGSYLVMPL